MVNFKTGLVAVAGAAIGVLTLKKLRNQGSSSDADSAAEIDEATEDIEDSKDDIEAAAADVNDAKDEAITAVRHVGGAVKHAGLAAGKAIKARQKSDEPTDLATESADAN